MDRKHQKRLEEKKQHDVMADYPTDAHAKEIFKRPAYCIKKLMLKGGHESRIYGGDKDGKEKD